MKQNQKAGIFLSPISLKIIPTQTKEKEWRKRKGLGGRKEEKRKEQRLYGYFSYNTHFTDFGGSVREKKNKHLFEGRGPFNANDLYDFLTT